MSLISKLLVLRLLVPKRLVSGLFLFTRGRNRRIFQMLFQVIILICEARKLRCMHANASCPVPEVYPGCRLVTVVEMSSIFRHGPISHIGRSF
jgi:hypothetical protein